LQAALQETGMNGRVTLVHRDAYALLGRATVVLLSSGTGTLEAALMGVPMVVCYRVAKLTYYVARNLISTRFIAMPNILLQEEVVPELLQEAVSPERFALETFRILDDDHRRQTMCAKLGRIRPMLGESGVLERAASLVLSEAGCARQERKPALDS
jgi:lipid-A-disaccharide synthase